MICGEILRATNAKFYPENPDSVHGVVYMGSGNRIGDAMMGADVPAMVLRGSRDPFCPAEVRLSTRTSTVACAKSHALSRLENSIIGLAC